MARRTDVGEYEVIVESPDVLLGTFANAFRVLPVSGDGCLLDFLVYSEREGQAAVQARVRVPRRFLDQIRKTLEEILLPAENQVSLLN